MRERSPEPLPASEIQTRLDRAEKFARRLGFVGNVEYRHAYGLTGGAQYCLAPTIEQDALVIYAEAFDRDGAGDDFSLAAIIAHERGHQLLHRHERLRRNLPQGMSEITEEALASLLGSLIVQQPQDIEMLHLKALFELVAHGLTLEDASRRVNEVLRYLEAVL